MSEEKVLVDENSKKELLEMRLAGKSTNNSNKAYTLEDFYNKSNSDSAEKQRCENNSQTTPVKIDKGSPFTPKSKTHNLQSRKRRTPVSFNISSYLSPSATKKYVRNSDSNSNDENTDSKKNEDIPPKIELDSTNKKPPNTTTVKVVEKENNKKILNSQSQNSTPLSNQNLDHLFLLDDFKRTISSLREENDQFKNITEKMRNILISLFQKNVLASIKKRNKRILKNNIKLGHITTVRQGVQFVEQWEKGNKFTKYEKALEQNQRTRDELEKRKKNLQRAIRTCYNGAGGGSVNDSFGEKSNVKPSKDIDINLNEIELIKLQLLSLKKEENEINGKLENLHKCRNVHLRELRNMSVENNSRFHGGQLLKDDSFMLMQAIGKGGFSEVFKAFDVVNMEEVACKIHQVCSEWREDRKNNYVKHAMREFQIHKNLKHPNIAHLLDVFVIDQNTFTSVMEYCETDLDFILKQYKTLPEREAKLIIIQVVSALKYLNELKTPVIHYDLKPANILFTDINNWHVKITDFGLSKIMPQSYMDTDMSGMELTSQGAGTYWYLPPECFVVGRNPPKITSKVDVWSIGVIFYQMLYGIKPFGHNMTQPDIVESKTILNARVVEFKPKPSVSNDGKDFIRRCLTYCKDKRPDVIQLAEDLYLTMGKRMLYNSTNDKLQSPTTTPNISIPRPALASILTNDTNSRSNP